MADEPLARLNNLTVARLFEEIAQSLEVAGEQGHRLRAYRRAARGVAAWSEPLEQMAAEGRLRDIPGIGAALAALIGEFLETGGMSTHARLVGEHPPGLAPLLNARGFGPAGVQALYDAIGATNLDEIERAAADGRLAHTLGQRRADDLLAQLPTLRNPSRTMRLKPGWETARLLVDLLQPAVARIEVAGAARRMCEMVVGGLDFVAQPDGSGTRLLDLLERLPSVVAVVSRDAEGSRVRLAEGIEVRLHLATPESFGSVMVRQTGSSAHLARLGSFGDFPSEAAVYASLGLPLIPPGAARGSGGDRGRPTRDAAAARRDGRPAGRSALPHVRDRRQRIARGHGARGEGAGLRVHGAHRP